MDQEVASAGARGPLPRNLAGPHRSSPALDSRLGELAKLADMLNAGLLTREEFDQLKAQLLQG